MRTDSIIWVASLTKAITGACAMQLDAKAVRIFEDFEATTYRSLN
jgi:hypothetical protein